VRAVATSLRPRRPEQADPQRGEAANTPKPSSVLTPIRLAPAAPANEPLGTAWATNAEPRSTTKKPTDRPTTATIEPTIQALTMKPENTVAQLRAGASASSSVSVAAVGEVRRRRRGSPASR
jgi:hypothetical protein